MHSKAIIIIDARERWSEKNSLGNREKWEFSNQADIKSNVSIIFSTFFPLLINPFTKWYKRYSEKWLKARTRRLRFELCTVYNVYWIIKFNNLLQFHTFTIHTYNFILFPSKYRAMFLIWNCSLNQIFNKIQFYKILQICSFQIVRF